MPKFMLAAAAALFVTPAFAAGHAAVAAHSTASHASTQQQRMKACAAKWDAMKAHNQTGGQTYRQFSSHCLKKS